MSERFPPGAQAPQTPHPGTITFVNLWNNTREVESADNVPDAIKFFCVDDKKNKRPREEAIYCIPIVQIETLSVDEDGKPVAPRDADFISIKSYGPGHSFVESTVTPPFRKRPPTGSQATSQPFVPQKGIELPQSLAPPRQDALSRHAQLSLWARVKAWLGIA